VSSASSKVEEVTSEASVTKEELKSIPFVHQVFSGLVVAVLVSVVLASSVVCNLVCINSFRYLHRIMVSFIKQSSLDVYIILSMH